MALYDFPQRFRLRGSGKTAADLASLNEILLENEVCIETDTGRGKTGDGSTPWNDLPYTMYGFADLTDLADGQVLLWNAASGKWLPSNGGYDDEDAQDAVGAMIADTATIDLEYSDAIPYLRANVNDDSITYAKMQNVSATARIIGRKTSGAGDPEEMTLSETLDLIGSAAQGDILYRGASGWARLGAGTSGQYLKSQGPGANPVWDNVASGGGGSMTWLETYTVAGSAVQTLTLASTFDLASDVEYYMQLMIDNPSGTQANYSLYVNGDTTAANYTRQSLNANASSTAARASDAVVFSINTPETGTGFIKMWLDFDGKARARSDMNRDVATTLRGDMTWWAKNSAANVTSITLSSNVAGSIGVGSKIRVYRIKP